MQGVMVFLVPLSIAAVTVVLGLGLFNMLKAGSPSRSQMLMRWRVILQAVAVALMMLVLWFNMR
ncbi:MAG TPA: twin transmembrane helix small protein [Beijerinckiaceae bacterium]|nr:twin transmembrane helix small protein [Beijerinckiaceae bacterium]